MSLLINIALYALIFYMVFRMFAMNKAQKKNRQIYDCMKKIKETDDFFTDVDEIIATIDNPAYVVKARVLKLWGVCYHNLWDRFAEALEDIDPAILITEKNGKCDITQTEDSFFYLYLAIPDILYNEKKDSERNALKEITDAYNDKLADQLVVAMAEADNKFFAGSDDKGLSFYEKLLSGDYGEYRYAKELIGFYKEAAAAMAYAIYKEKGEMEKTEDIISLVYDFKNTGIGGKWVPGLNLDLPALPEESENNEVEEEEEETYLLDNKDESEEKEETSDR